MSATAIILLLIIGISVGMVMGLTGAGGGMLAVPALVYTQGWTMQQAMPVALLAVSVGALIGAIGGLRRKQVRYKAALLMALIGGPVSSLGILVAKNMSQKWLMGVFSFVLLIVIGRLLFQLRLENFDDNNRDAFAKVNANTGRFDWNIKTASIISGIGGCAGFTTGLLGVGGGFVIVPLLRHFTNLSMQSAAATSLMVITLVGSVAVTSAVMHGAQLPLLFSTIFVLASVIGVLFGRQLTAHLPAKIIQLVFISLLMIVAISFIVKAGGSF